MEPEQFRAYDAQRRPILGDDGEPRVFTSHVAATQAMQDANALALLDGEPPPLAVPLLPGQPNIRQDEETLNSWTAECDFPGCPASATFEAWLPSVEGDSQLSSTDPDHISAAAASQGWRVEDDGGTYCPSH